MKRVVDLASELHTPVSVAQAAELMAKIPVWEAAPDLEAQRLMPKRVSAVLVLLAERLRLLERVAGGRMSPTVVHAHHNAVPGPESVVLKEWSPARQRRELERELRRLDHEDRRGARRRRS